MSASMYPVYSNADHPSKAFGMLGGAGVFPAKTVMSALLT
ncbi:MAG: hypothetical protein [Olavius algarvensis Delta 4 endosymbiont]|nr:MAG: hypothetical protein [Olavius algarvensis Delta 4 endosymbiont]